MDAIIILIIAGIIAYGLERNSRRQSQSRRQLAGSSDIIDRDRERFLSDIRAIL